MVEESDEKDGFFRPEVFFFFLLFPISSDFEFEDKLHLSFLSFFFCLNRIFLGGEDFSSFALTKPSSAGHLYESPALTLPFCPALSSEFTKWEIKLNWDRSSCASVYSRSLRNGP